jgi:uncharacterized membrane protein (DUF2068 family)
MRAGHERTDVARVVDRRRHLATAVCGWAGHVCPAADVAELDGPLFVGIDLPGGDLPGGDLPGGDLAGVDRTQGDPGRRRLCRCLRCDAWLVAEVPATPSRARLPAPEELPIPRRGAALRSAVVVRVIAVERGIHSLVFALVAALAIALRAELTGVKGWVRDLLHRLTTNSNGTGTAIGNGFLVKEGHHLLTLRSSTLDLVIVAAVAYCLVEGVEAVGLWRERRWAEYLTVVATAGFVPYEVIELAGGVSALKVGALILNLVVLAYLLWSKELFGIGRWRHRGVSEAAGPAWEDFLGPGVAPQVA